MCPSKGVADWLCFVVSGQSWADVLGLLSTFPLAITGASDDEGMGVMSQAIQGGAGEQIIVKDFGPFLKGAITGDDDGGAFVAFADDLVQILGGLGGERIQAEIIQDEKLGGEKLGQQAGVSPAGLGGVQLFEQVMDWIGQHSKVAFEGFEAQAVGEVAFSGPTWAAQQDILVAGDKGAGSQILNEGAIDAWGSGEVKVSQRLEAIAAGLGQAHGQAPLVAPFQFIIEQQGQELDRAELPLGRLGGSEIQRVGHAR